MAQRKVTTPGQSSSNLYFVYTRRRDSEGRLIEGQWMGIQGWRQGLKGPLTKNEAQRIQAQVGAEIIPVEVEDFEHLIVQAMRKVGIEPPEDLEELAEDDETKRLKAENEELRKTVSTLEEQLEAYIAQTEEDTEEDTEEPSKEDETLGVDELEDVIYEGTTPEETDEEEDEEETSDVEEEETTDVDVSTLEDADGAPEWPGYNEAINTMNDFDFNWMEAGGGRKQANVKDAWEEFASQFA